jgi:hypothetical protein
MENYEESVKREAAEVRRQIESVLKIWDGGHTVSMNATLLQGLGSIAMKYLGVLEACIETFGTEEE